jgi:hypothetical protein
MFYLDDPVLLVKMIMVYLAGTIILLLWFVLGMPATLDTKLPYSSDWLALIFLMVLLWICLSTDSRQHPAAKKI